MRQTLTRWSKQTIIDIGTVLRAPLFWGLLGIWGVVSVVLWHLPVEPVEHVTLALISGLAVAMVLTHFHAVADFFDPPGGRRDLGHWYQFGWFLIWVYVCVAFVSMIGFRLAGAEVPQEWRNVLRIWIVASACIQLATPFFVRDAELEVRIAGARKGLFAAIMVVLAVAAVALIGMG